MSFFITLLVQVILIILSDLLAPKPDFEEAKPSGIGDFRLPTATEQRKVPMLFGTVQSAGPNVVWWGDLLQEPVVIKVKTGLFSSEKVIKNYRYHIGVQQVICEGEVDDLLRVWVSDDLIFDSVDGGDTAVVHEGTFDVDLPNLFGGEDHGQGGMVGTYQFFAGTPLQNVSGYLSLHQKFPFGSGATPAYRGYCYIAPHLVHILVGTSTNIRPMKWEARRTPDPLGITPLHRINTFDANIMNVMFEAMTNTDWGAGLDPTTISTSSFITAATTLHGEGNGFSMIIDKEEDIGVFIKRLEQQADMIIFQNPFSGKWEAKLIRDDYSIGSVFAMTVENTKNISSYVQSTWEDTKNQVSVPFNQRNDSYKATYGFAQNGANVRVVGKKQPTSVSFAGIKDATLANAIAWRAMRTLSQPLIAMTAILDRSAFGQLPGDVMAFTDPDYNAVQTPMRIQSVDYGDLFKGEIRMKLIQDIFATTNGSFTPPPTTRWIIPTDNLVRFPDAQSLVIEAPRALAVRNPDPNEYDDRGDLTVAHIFCAARVAGTSIDFDIRTRNATFPTVPNGAYTVTNEAGRVTQFMRIGELQDALTADSAYPHSEIILTVGIDTQGTLINSFPIIQNLQDLGTELLTLLYVGGEFMLVESVETEAGGLVQLNNTYRGVLDSVQADHAVGDEVFLLFTGAGLTTFSYPQGDDVDVLLIPNGIKETLTEAAAAPAIQILMDNRHSRPYPVSEFDLDGVRMDLTDVSLEGTGSGEDVGVLFSNINRRDFQSQNEVDILSAEDADFNTAYGADFSYLTTLIVSNGGTELATVAIALLVSGAVRKFDILQALGDTALPSSLTFGVRSTHTVEAVVYDNIQDFEITSTLSDDEVGLHAFGAKDTGVYSVIYDVPSPTEAGFDHIFTLSSSFTAGTVEYRINGGANTLLISAGGTTGTILAAAISNGDDIEVRHNSSDSNAQKLITLRTNTVKKAYGIFHV